MSPAERTVWQRRFHVTPAALWIGQRLSGLALAPLVALHVAWPGLGRHPLFLLLMVAIVAAHGYAGLLRIRQGAAQRPWVRGVALAWTAVVIAAGAAIALAGSR